MKPLTGPHAFGLISAPPRDNPASNGSEQRLTIDKPHAAPRKTGRIAVMTLLVIAVAASFVAVPVSYAIHWHLKAR